MAYPQYNDKEFNKKITKANEKYRIEKELIYKPLRELCKPPNKFALQKPQKFVSNYIHPNTPYKGLLVYHNIGSGKTCTAIRICEHFKTKLRVLFILPASLESNLRDELRTMCADNNYITKNEYKLYNLETASDDKRLQIIEKSDERIDKYYNILSYDKFTDLIKSRNFSFANTLLVIDEVQNLISETGLRYNLLRKKIDNTCNKNTRIVLLSGTPIFDKPSELALVMNLLPLPTKIDEGNDFNNKYITYSETKQNIPLFTIKERAELIKKLTGFVSYYKGMPSKSFPSHHVHIVKCTMEKFQYASYKKVMTGEVKKAKKYQDSIFNLPKTFFIGGRMISNVAYPNQKYQEAGFTSWKGNALTSSNLKKYSIKFYKIMKKLSTTKGKCFVYSNFRKYGGIEAFVAVLEANGWINFDNKNPSQHHKGIFAIWSGNETYNYKQRVKYYFNQKNHPLRLIVGSPSIKEGVTLKRVEQVHILEPYWNHSRLLQILGRAVRYCSHSDMPKQLQHVDVFLYIAVRPKETKYTHKEHILDQMSVDRYILYLAQSKQHIIQQFEQLLQESSVDCELNYFLSREQNNTFRCSK